MEGFYSESFEQSSSSDEDFEFSVQSQLFKNQIHRYMHIDDIGQINTNFTSEEHALKLTDLLKNNKDNLTFATVKYFPVDLKEKIYISAVDYLCQRNLIIITFNELEGGIVHDESQYAHFLQLLEDVDEFNENNQMNRPPNDLGYTIKYYDLA